jgi:hypothetical protein
MTPRTDLKGIAQALKACRTIAKERFQHSDIAFSELRHHCGNADEKYVCMARYDRG